MTGTEAPLRDLLAARLPDYLVTRIVPLGEGMENTAHLVNGELVLRLSKDDDPEATIAREADLLAILDDFATLTIPRPVFAAGTAMAYRMLPGTPVFDLPAAWRDQHAARVAAQLGEFLAGLHRIPLDLIAGVARVEDDPLSVWLDDAAGSYAVAVDRIPPQHRAWIEVFLSAGLPAPEPLKVFSHNDLGIEHVLVDIESAAVTGVIDWTDAAIGDPAYDLGLILRDLGPAALDSALTSWPERERAALADRALFYGRCSALEDLEFGLTPGRDRYAAKAIASLDWLFQA